MRVILATILLTLIFMAGQAHAQGQSPLSVSVDVVRSELKQQVARGFSGSVLIATDGTVRLDEGFGTENRVKVQSATRFWIASVAKQFTSAAILKCEEKGLLNLNDPLLRFFPTAPLDKRAITIEQLLTHTSGLDQSYVSENATDRNNAVTMMLREPLVDKPGAKFHYSNSNYQLAVAIVEVVTKQSYRDFVWDELWAPAGMQSTGFAGDNEARFVLPARLTTPERLHRINWGGANVYSTTGDLYRWYAALRGGRVLSPQAVARLMCPSVAIEEGQAGLGWFVGKTKYGSVEVFTRGNEDFGPNSLIYIYPHADTQIIILTHGGDHDDQTSWSRFILGKIEEALGL